jgi:hypothetical protein
VIDEISPAIAVQIRRQAEMTVTFERRMGGVG